MSEFTDFFSEMELKILHYLTISPQTFEQLLERCKVCKDDWIKKRLLSIKKVVGDLNLKRCVHGAWTYIRKKVFLNKITPLGLAILKEYKKEIPHPESVYQKFYPNLSIEHTSCYGTRDNRVLIEKTNVTGRIANWLIENDTILIDDNKKQYCFSRKIMKENIRPNMNIFKDGVFIVGSDYNLKYMKDYFKGLVYVMLDITDVAKLIESVKILLKKGKKLTPDQLNNPNLLKILNVFDKCLTDNIPSRQLRELKHPIQVNSEFVIML